MLRATYLFLTIIVLQFKIIKINIQYYESANTPNIYELLYKRGTTLIISADALQGNDF